MPLLLPFVSLALAATDPVPTSRPPEPVAPTTEGFWSETLPNGLEVSILADPTYPVVSTQIWVQVGSAHEGPREQGFAHLFEHLMFGETTNNTKDVYSRWITTHGGEENAYTMFDNTVYHSLVAAAWQDRVLELEADRFANLKLEQGNLDNEKKIVTEELRLRTENEPFSRLLNVLLSALFGDHPYAHSPAGTKEDIASADLGLCRKFYEGYYQPRNLHLVIVGPVDGPAMLARATELFGPLGGEALAPPPVPPLLQHAFPERVELREDIPPIKVAALVYRTPAPREPGWWAVQVMNRMLLGSELDRFREEIITKGHHALEAQTVVFDLEAGGFVGFGSVSLFLRGKEKAVGFLHEAVGTLNGLQWATEETLATAKRALLKDELEKAYYAEDRASDIGLAFAWRDDARLGVEGRAEAVRAVTLEQVQAAWRTYIAEAKPVEVLVMKGKAAEVDQPEQAEVATAGGAK